MVLFSKNAEKFRPNPCPSVPDISFKPRGGDSGAPSEAQTELRGQEKLSI